MHSPPIEYNETEDLHKSVYVKNTTLQLTVYVVDDGDPVRGATASVTMVVDNSCLVDVEFGQIPFQFNIDIEKGFLYFVVPGYRYYNFRKYYFFFKRLKKSEIRVIFILESTNNPLC